MTVLDLNVFWHQFHSCWFNMHGFCDNAMLCSDCPDRSMCDLISALNGRVRDYVYTTPNFGEQELKNGK